MAPAPSKIEIIAVNDRAIRNAKRRRQSLTERLRARAQGGEGIGTSPSPADTGTQTELEFEFEPGELERAIHARIVEKCGRRTYWEDWANDIARIAQTHITRIETIVLNPANRKERRAFRTFVEELRDDLNPAITENEVIEMLAQHLITQPVFEALFEGYSFTDNNPVSQGMRETLNLLNGHHLEKEADTLQGFYASVKMRAEGIDNVAGKQRIVVELYDKFFRNAFPRVTERLGIVYTPVEVVDFILHSIDHLLRQEFGQTLGNPGVHILDPFVGTGTFITRLLQSDLITPEELPYKYRHEIHANEIVLLAYYIAAINIEMAYHEQMGDEYEPFPGICLTDTFQMYESDDLISEILVDNSNRRTQQKELKDIRVIMGNPPYSAGQRSENDNNDNIEYPLLDQRIRTTYAERSEATLSKALYDSYIRAIRWGSDRLGKGGIIGFVTNAGWIEGNAMDGLRKYLAEEFSSIYNERVYQMPRIFPNAEAGNVVICLTGLGESRGFSTLIASVIPNFHFIAGSQCFPRYLYDEDGNNRRDAITDQGLAHFQTAYPGETIPRTTSSTTSTASCIPRTTAPATPITSPRNSPASRR
uniref:site-specific DNA-methyltransferase (adenine-specific) n=1 Tax=Candidatus Kentrum sp. FW TaxID=2126338 RepID=A0A450S0T6_9GAMM|nr:MAG: N-6 DNA Methylase [Candidatus Kentron sp. FW]